MLTTTVYFYNNRKYFIKCAKFYMASSTFRRFKYNFKRLCNSYSFAAEQSIQTSKVSEKTFPIVTEENQYDVLSDIVTPLWKLDYVEQLVSKKSWSRQVVEKIKSHNLPRSRTRIHNVIPSPVIDSYRNKDEFSVRTGVDGNEKTVGFFTGSPADGEVICVPPTKLISLKEEHITLSQVFQKFIRLSSLRACHKLDDGGFWRNLVVRSNQEGDIMAIVTGHSRGISESQFEKVKDEVRDFFLMIYPNISSLYIQACPNTRCTGDVAPFILLHGQEHLYEALGDIHVRISPDSFFQINTAAANLLYSNTLKLLKVTSKSTLLDLCCGIGCLSLVASKSVRGCVGIDSVKNSVEDAKFNAAYNEIRNCYFLAGRIEEKLGTQLFHMNSASDVVAVLNPGRAGVNYHVVKMLRRHPGIQRLAYVSCQADGRNPMRNFVDLCSPKSDYSPPFIITDVQAIDMFPQTPHCELVLIFQR